MERIRNTFDRDTFVVFPSELSAEDLDASTSQLHMIIPTAEEFHADVDPERNRRFRDEFGGITNIPFSSTELPHANLRCSGFPRRAIPTGPAIHSPRSSNDILAWMSLIGGDHD